MLSYDLSHELYDTAKHLLARPLQIKSRILWRRVAELHGAVETLSGLRPADQILMLDGQPLVDKMQLLSHFGLPSVSKI